jgi:dephospho-CoA kinase
MLIGITGTNGSGKGAVVEYLVAVKGFSRFSGRTVILEALEERHLPAKRSLMRDAANDLRKEHGPAYIIEKLYGMAEGQSNAVLESVRTIGEAEFLKSKGAYIIAVDADKKLRHERVTSMSHDVTPLTFEEFTALEDQEMSSSEPWDMNVFGVMQMADVRIENNGTLEELHAKVDEALKNFK